ncbi:MAG: F0F1 ATP synthase subunit A [Chloroflexi bacterium]|nr:MAG: F0F1 ATP synthase subunit A [Chloroflexota bacterium]
MNLKSSLPYIIGGLIVAVVGALFIKMPAPLISIKAEPLFSIGPLTVTNSLFSSWIVTVVIFLFFFMATRKLEYMPGGLQNFVEMLVEGLYNLTEGVSGSQWVSKFFLVPATIFIFVVVSNLFGVFIGVPLSAVGVCESPHHGEAAAAEGGHEADTGHETEAATTERAPLGCEPGQVLVPFFRAPSADLNFTFALAFITQAMAWTFGIMALGLGGFMGKFFIFDKLRSAKGGGDIAMGLIDVFVGLLELLSEFVKIVAFSFRLFGNIFAGEVMLLVITFLVPLLIVTPLIGFEVFVGIIQAFVFYILSVAFYKVAITGHGDHDEAH